MPSPNDTLEDLLRLVCENKSSEQLLSAWYWEGEHDTWHSGLRLCLIGFDQIACIRFADTCKLPPIRGVALMLAFLAGSAKRTEWVQYKIVQYLAALHCSGVGQAALPLALHACLAIEYFKDDDYIKSGLQGSLAASLSKIAPRDAIYHGLLALKAGNIRGLADCGVALQRLDLPLVRTGDLVAAVAINEAIGSPLKFDTKAMYSTASSAVRKTPRALPTEIVHQAPELDSRHYIFAKAGSPMPLHPIDICRVEDATFSGDLSKLGRPQFYTQVGDTCIADLSLGAQPFVEKSVVDLGAPLFIIDDVFSGKPNISHFLLDRVPRLLAYRRLPIVDAKLLLLETDVYFRDALHAIGVENFAIPVERRFSYRTPQLFLHSNAFANWDHPANLGNPQTLQQLRSAFGVPTAGPADRRIAISRSDANGRKMINWQEIEPVLRKHGYQSVVLSGMSFAEQRELFSRASHVTGVHGAGLTNILFAPVQACLLEILPPLVATSTYWMLANGIGHRYGSLIATDPVMPSPDYATWVHDPSYNDRDVWVDPAQLDASLAAMG